MAGRQVHFNLAKISLKDLWAKCKGRCVNACGCWSPLARATDDRSKVTCKRCLHWLEKEHE